MIELRGSCHPGLFCSLDWTGPGLSCIEKKIYQSVIFFHGLSADLNVAEWYDGTGMEIGLVKFCLKSFFCYITVKTKFSF